MPTPTPIGTLCDTIPDVSAVAVEQFAAAAELPPEVVGCEVEVEADPDVALAEDSVPLPAISRMYPLET